MKRLIIQSSHRKTGLVLIAGLMLLVAVLAASWESSKFLDTGQDTKSCTIITAVKGDTVLFANNEDHSEPEVVMGIIPPSSSRYGSLQLGYRIRDGEQYFISFEGAMNDQGLAWDINGLPESALNPHPERPFSHAADNYLSRITQKAATVEEAIALAEQFDFGTTLDFQLHIADATGAAAVLSAGADGEVTFTRKEPGDGYLVSTNFNKANPENARPFTGTLDRRYEKATARMDGLLADALPLTAKQMTAILDEVHIEYPGSYTVYSNVFDLQNKRVHLAYLTRYEDMITLDLAEEMAKGEQIYEMSDLFPQATIESGLRDYHSSETRAIVVVLVIIVVLLVLLAVLLFTVIWGSRRYRSRRNTKMGKTAPAVEGRSA